MPNDYLDMRDIAKITELVRAYCPPDRPHAFRTCDNRECLSDCLHCWVEWLNDDAKTKGD